jgi:hypothetical protein
MRVVARKPSSKSAPKNRATQILDEIVPYQVITSPRRNVTDDAKISGRVREVNMVVLAATNVSLVKRVRSKTEIDSSLLPGDPVRLVGILIQSGYQSLQWLHVEWIIVSKLLNLVGWRFKPVVDDLRLGLAEVYRPNDLPEVAERQGQIAPNSTLQFVHLLGSVLRWGNQGAVRLRE